MPQRPQDHRSVQLITRPKISDAGDFSTQPIMDWVKNMIALASRGLESKKKRETRCGIGGSHYARL